MSGKNGTAKRHTHFSATDTKDLTPPKRSNNAMPFRFVANGTDPRAALSRRMSGDNIDPRRNFNEECGWPDKILPRDYLDMFQRNEYAYRAVTIYPDECFAVSPDIYETERVRNTPFEKKVAALTDFDEDGNPVDPETNLFSFWHKVDVCGCLGRFSGLLIGIDDGLELSDPAAGIDDFGHMVEGIDQRELLYLRAFDESTVRVDSIENKKSSPRYGKPKSYQIRLAHLTINSETFGSDSAQEDWDEDVVHWSRMVHYTNNNLTSVTYGGPIMRPIFNRLLDLSKILGGGAEMFYQGGFPGIAFTLDPRILESGLPDIDEDTIDEQMYLYANRMQRWLNLVGYEAKSLAPNIADPTGNVMVQLQAIATALGVPLRIFLGAEQAQLASGQDVRTWNRRLTRRMTKQLTPVLIRPTIDRLVALGVVPKPKKGWKSYKVVWPDVNVPDEDEQTTVGDRRAASIMKYMQTGAWQIMHPFTFFTRILRFSTDEANVMIEELKQMTKIDIKPVQAITAQLSPPKPGLGNAAKVKPAGKAASSGVKGRSPSKPPRGGRTK